MQLWRLPMATNVDVPFSGWSGGLGSSVEVLEDGAPSLRGWAGLGLSQVEKSGQRAALIFASSEW